jgi:hypothetical protein
MTALSTIDGPAVAEAYSFDGIDSIVHVGGGHGLLLAAIVRVDGHVQDIQVVNSLGHGLDEQAIKSLRASTFEPGTNGGVPVPVLIRMEMDFTSAKLPIRR